MADVTLKKGDSIKTETGQELTILDKLGEGGPVLVYKVDFGGKPYALKWYLKTNYLDHIDRKAFKYNLSENIRRGAPAPQFLWPKMLIEEVDGTFGYIMDIFPNGYTSLDDYYWGKAYFPSWNAIISVALSLVESFRLLHLNGYSYQGLNYAMLRADPSRTDEKNVLICYNDNVAPDGTNFGIQGDWCFMAPEVTMGKALPNTQTDEYSLAVVLFGLFFRGHPLEGRYTLKHAAISTMGTDKVIYGSHPIFCYDPVNDKNRPDPVVHKNGVLHYWPIVTKEFKEPFVKAFTIGLKDPMKRVREVEWMKALIDLRSNLIHVQKNGQYKEEFVNLKQPKLPEGSLRIRIGDKNVVALSNGGRLYACQTTSDIVDFRTVTAKVGIYNNNPESLIMQNNTALLWDYTLPGKEPVESEPQGIIPLIPGVKINFAGIEGDVF